MSQPYLLKTHLHRSLKIKNLEMGSTQISSQKPESKTPISHFSTQT